MGYQGFKKNLQNELNCDLSVECQGSETISLVLFVHKTFMKETHFPAEDKGHKKIRAWGTRVSREAPSRWTHWWCCQLSVEDQQAWERGLSPQDIVLPGKLQ